MTVTIYELSTGRLLRTYAGPSPQSQLVDGEAIYEGALPLLGCRIENGEPVDFAPVAASADLEWEPGERRFVMTAAATARREAQAQIDALERQQARALREVTLNRGSQADARKKLEDIDDQIAALRVKLQT